MDRQNDMDRALLQTVKEMRKELTELNQLIGALTEVLKIEITDLAVRVEGAANMISMNLG